MAYYLTPNAYRMEFSLSEFLAGGTVTALVQGGFRYLAKRKENKVDLAQNTADIRQIHKIMQDIIDETLMNRFLVFVGEDSAGILAAGKNLFVSCQYEKINKEEGLEPILDDIQRWKADESYYDIFSDMLRHGQAVIKTDTMPEGKLKDLYMAQGVKCAKVFHLMTTKKLDKVFYCSIATTIRDEIKLEDKVKVDSAIDKLRTIFQKHKKFYS